LCCISDRQVIGGDWNDDDADALLVRDRLAAQPGTSVGASGDTKDVTDGNDFLIQVAAGPDTADMALLARGTVPAPEIELQLLARFTRSLAALWQNAATAERELVTALDGTRSASGHRDHRHLKRAQRVVDRCEISVDKRLQCRDL